MATAKVEKPFAAGLPSGLDEAMEVEVEATFEEDEDLYTNLKTLQRQLEFYDIQARFKGCTSISFWRMVVCQPMRKAVQPASRVLLSNTRSLSGIITCLNLIC